jgi:hypothetical protein
MNIQTLQRHAEHCLEQAHKATDETQRMRFLRAANAWRSLSRLKSELDAVFFEPDEKPSQSKAA